MSAPSGTVATARASATDRPAFVPQIPVLNYHHIHDGEDSYFRTRPKLFRRQMEILLDEGYVPITPARLAGLRGVASCDEKYVLVSFDDAYENFLHHAWPILRKLEIPATLFVIVDAIGRDNDWDETRWSTHRHLDLAQLRALRAEGVSMGSHTLSHPTLVATDRARLEAELRGSRRSLQELLGASVSTLAYPGGAVDDTVKSLAAQHYELGFATDSDADGDVCDAFLIPRFDPCFYGDENVFRRELRRHSAYARRRESEVMPGVRADRGRAAGALGTVSPTERNVLGICSTGHGASLALISGAHGIRAMTLDRFVGEKRSMLFSRDELADILDPDGACEVHDIFLAAYGQFPPAYVFEDVFEPFLARLLKDLPIGAEDIDLVVGSHSHFAINGFRLGGELPRYFPNAEVFLDLEHHEIHRHQAYFSSPFDNAALLTVDASGEALDRLDGDMLAMTLAEAEGDQIRLLEEHRFPVSSPGRVYGLFTHFLGFRDGQEGKTMGLAAFGRDTIYRQLRPSLQLFEDGSFELMPDDELRRWLLEICAVREKSDPIEPVHEDIAFAGQALLEDILQNAVSCLERCTRSTRLCLAGGVALNSVANEKVFRHSRFEEIHVMPNCGDPGHALGCALFGDRTLFQQPATRGVADEYLGPRYSSEECRRALAATELEIRRFDRSSALAAHVGHLLTEGQIVGWFQGCSEYGPRALGNRSLLADPRGPGMADRLNARVKHRELFRPFAPAVLEEKVATWFDLDGPSPYMLRVVTVRPERRSQVPAITHVDGTARVQTVSRQANPRFHELISAFASLTGVDLVLNTSFNIAGKPIVETPRDAVECFLATGIDVLVLGQDVVRKPPAEES